MSEEKYREFTVIECQDKTYQAFEYRKSHDQLVNQFHVIEYSAYEKLQSENTLLKKAYEDMYTQLTNYLNDPANKIQSENDRLKKYVISGYQIIEDEMKAEIEKLKAENAELKNEISFNSQFEEIEDSLHAKILSAAKFSYSSYSMSVRGQAITKADDFAYHVIGATKGFLEKQIKEKLTKLTRQRDIMKKALEFYVDKMILEPNGVVDYTTLEYDGETARKALQEADGMETTITGAIIPGAGYVEIKPVEIEYGKSPQGELTLKDD